MPITEKQTVTINSGFAHPADTTKQVQFDMSGITAGSPAVVTVPAASGTMAYTESGTFTGTLTGCTTSPTCTFTYSKVGRTVTLMTDVSGLSGTSNASSKSINTNMPAHLYPSQTGGGFLFSGQDNGAGYVANFGYLAASNPDIVLTRTVGGTTWTASGAFVVYVPVITYVCVA